MALPILLSGAASPTLPADPLVKYTVKQLAANGVATYLDILATTAFVEGGCLIFTDAQGTFKGFAVGQWVSFKRVD